MSIKERLNILKQGVEIAQSKGALSLDDAVLAKQALVSAEKGENIDVVIHILVKMIQLAQSKGSYSLKDAYILYIAIDGINKEIENMNIDKEKSEAKAEVDESEKSAE